MAGHYIRKRVRAADWSFSLAAFSGALLLTGFLFFRLGLSGRDDFGTIIVLVGAMLGLALLLSLYAIGRIWSRGSFGGGRALAGLFLGLVVAIPFAIGAVLAVENPVGNAARTAGMVNDGDGPGLADGTLLLGREFPATAREVYQVSRLVADDMGWQVEDVDSAGLPRPAAGDLGVAGTVLVPRPTLRSSFDAASRYDPFADIDAQDYTLLAVAAAPLFGFESDVTIRIQEDAGSTFVDLQAMSRDLPRDLGQNRRFIEAFLSRLEAAMAVAQSGAVEE